MDSGEKLGRLNSPGTASEGGVEGWRSGGSGCGLRLRRVAPTSSAVCHDRSLKLHWPGSDTTRHRGGPACLSCCPISACPSAGPSSCQTECSRTTWCVAATSAGEQRWACTGSCRQSPGQRGELSHLGHFCSDWERKGLEWSVLIHGTQIDLPPVYTLGRDTCHGRASRQKLPGNFLASPPSVLLINLQASILPALTLSTPAADLVVTAWGSCPLQSALVSALASGRIGPASTLMGKEEDIFTST